MSRFVLFTAATATLALAVGCNRDQKPAPSAPVQTAQLSPVQAAQVSPTEGERSPFEVQGDVVKVNNRLCAVSHSPMAENTLGQFVSRVKYEGSNPKFAGKSLEFNQCCGMCIEKFPSMWAQNRDGIMKFHGLE